MSRDAGDAGAAAPLCARVLRLRRVRPSALLCFLFFEGMVALGVLLALAELVSWWAVPVLPAAVAGMVKLNDVLARPPAGDPAGAPVPPRAAVAAPPGPGAPQEQRAQPQEQRARELRQVSRDLAETLDPADSPRQRFRQSARRRYR